MPKKQPADLDLHCLQRQGIFMFNRTRVKNCWMCGKSVDPNYVFLLYMIWSVQFTHDYMAQYLRVNVVCTVLKKDLYTICEHSTGKLWAQLFKT